MQELFDKSEMIKFEERGNLPEEQGIYFITDLKEIFYIGRTLNLRQRCQNVSNHHIFRKIANLENTYVGYFLVDEDICHNTEIELLQKYKPKYNKNSVSGKNRDQAITFFVSTDERKFIDETSKLENISRSNFIRKVVFEYLDKNYDQIKKGEAFVRISKYNLLLIINYLSMRTVNHKDPKANKILKMLFD